MDPRAMFEPPAVPREDPPSAEPRPVPPSSVRHRWWLHIGLFLATLVSTTFTAAGWPPDIGQGLLYGVPVMAILLCHEMGHYVMCLRYRVPATLPYFIPFPLSLFGTMGAVIRMKGGIYGRKPLFDIGIAGPLAGLLVAVPVTFIGLTLSDVTPSGEIPSGTISLGEPILFRWLARLALGALPEDADTILHPLAFAGWAGFFVTALNLLPIGQLDGGHVTHALFPRRSLAIARIAFAGLALAAIRFPGWILLAALTLFMGLRHPPVASYEDLGRGRFWLGVISLILFALTFTPQPFGAFP